MNRSLNECIDYTLLRPEMTAEDLGPLCRKAVEAHFYAVCVPSYFARHVRGLLAGTDVRVAAVVGFPLGMLPVEAKLREMELALDMGAKEIDVVMNHSAFRSGEIDKVTIELVELQRLAFEENAVLKVIIEQGLLKTDQVRELCQLMNEVKPDFVKTSSGYVTPGATIEGVQLLRELLLPDILIKASGGIRTTQQALDLLNAGANRIGTSAPL
jgi:deoxyribose-phosphate aldolase